MTEKPIKELIDAAEALLKCFESNDWQGITKDVARLRKAVDSSKINT